MMLKVLFYSYYCTQLGMVEFKYLAVDGEVIQANASYKQNKHLKGLQEEIARTKASLTKLVEKEPNEDFTQELKREQLRTKYRRSSRSSNG